MEKVHDIGVAEDKIPYYRKGYQYHEGKHAYAVKIAPGNDRFNA